MNNFKFSRIHNLTCDFILNNNLICHAYITIKAKKKERILRVKLKEIQECKTR